ncbi:hypothetical protein L3X07_05525 [Levilactobacillus brevis]|nr:hypothetical protein [Levilactobacillus brevis]
MATTQLYATKEMVTYNGMHYVYLETAKRPLGGSTNHLKRLLRAGIKIRASNC